MKAAPTVLVVDDNADLCTMIQDYLKSNGFEVMCAGNGTEAADLLDNQTIDLAMIDLLLPGPLSQRELAQSLFVTPNTLKTHLRANYRKLGADSARGWCCWLASPGLR